MNFLFGLNRPNGIGWAFLFYFVHLFILFAGLFLIGMVIAGTMAAMNHGELDGLSARGGTIGIIGAIAYCSLLCIWVVYRRKLHPACYAFLLLVIPGAFALGGIVGLVVPAILTTRGS
jgi:predicted ferric reductase